MNQALFQRIINMRDGRSGGSSGEAWRQGGRGRDGGREGGSLACRQDHWGIEGGEWRSKRGVRGRSRPPLVSLGNCRQINQGSRLPHRSRGGRKVRPQAPPHSYPHTHLHHTEEVLPTPPPVTIHPPCSLPLPPPRHDLLTLPLRALPLSALADLSTSR